MITINVDLDRKCVECKRGGATDNGLCLRCITKAVQGKPMKSAEGKATQARFNEVAREAGRGA